MLLMTSTDIQPESKHRGIYILTLLLVDLGTIGEGESVTPNTKFMKTRRLQNSGYLIGYVRLPSIGENVTFDFSTLLEIVNCDFAQTFSINNTHRYRGHIKFL